MDNVLKKFGYSVSENTKIWTKGVWTVRFDDEDYMEIYDTTVNDEGWLYYYGATSTLESVLTEIDTFPKYSIR